MHRKWVAAAVAAFVVIAAAYLGSPYWAARQLRSAAESGDVDRIEAAVDFPAVRENLKAQLMVALTTQMDSDPKMKGNPFAGIGAMLMPAVVQRTVDSFVTPQGLAAVIQRGKLEQAKTKQPAPQLTYEYDWRGLNRFAVGMRAKQVTADRVPELVFERRGLFSWKLIRLDLPVATLTGD